MDWDLKRPSWGLTELEGETITHIASIVGSSSSGGHRSRGDCSVDLKLGRFGDFGEEFVEKWKNPNKLSTMASPSPPSGSSKRARAPNNGTQTVSCLVDGCKSDLSNCREYHRKHKVCEFHSKSPNVMVGGQEQRFCQQCSRFHLLVEFDEVKRSCRKRLDGHNRRRRKPQPESLFTNSRRYLSNYQGTKLLSFPSPQIHATTATVSKHAWTGSVKPVEDTTVLYNRHQQLHLVDKQNLFSQSWPAYRNNGRKQFPFLHGNSSTLGSQTVPKASTCQPLLNTVASTEGDRGSRKIICDGFARVLGSDRALSLLSTLPSQTLGIGLGHMVQQHQQQPDLIPQAESLVPALHYNDLSQPSCTQDMGDDESAGLVLVPKSSNGNLQYQMIFQVLPDGSYGNEATPQTLPFAGE